MTKKKFFVSALLLFAILSVNAQDSSKLVLLKALSSIQSAVLQNNKEQVSDFFNFPLSDKIIKQKIEGVAPNKIIIKEVNKQTFLKYYDRIFTKQIIELFKTLNVSKLERVSVFRTEIVPQNKTNWCSNTYRTSLSETEINFIHLTSYRIDIPLPANARCKETEEQWTFTMENEKLKFSKISKKKFK